MVTPVFLFVVLLLFSTVNEIHSKEQEQEQEEEEQEGGGGGEGGIISGWKRLLLEAKEEGDDHSEKVRLWLDRGVGNVNARDDAGWTPLHDASYLRDQSEIVRLLLRYGAHVDARNDQGRTPLHHAAFFDHVMVVRLLLDHGADARVRDQDGKTPLELARSTRRSKVVPILEHAMMMMTKTTTSTKTSSSSKTSSSDRSVPRFVENATEVQIFHAMVDMCRRLSSLDMDRCILHVMNAFQDQHHQDDDLYHRRIQEEDWRSHTNCTCSEQRQRQQRQKQQTTPPANETNHVNTQKEERYEYNHHRDACSIPASANETTLNEGRRGREGCQKRGHFLVDVALFFFSSSSVAVSIIIAITLLKGGNVVPVSWKGSRMFVTMKKEEEEEEEDVDGEMDMDRGHEERKERRAVVSQWLDDRIPSLCHDDCRAYTTALIDNGFDSTEALGEVLEEDHLDRIRMKLGHKRLLVKRLANEGHDNFSDRDDFEMRRSSTFWPPRRLPAYDDDDDDDDDHDDDHDNDHDNDNASLSTPE